ncbi:MFS transporter [Streptomyces rapamycinicus]|uniref:MFS transporter n=2 Tax=Streptomyces rapamycinicus TaxID=1226757 RepID=A0A0A0NIN6_STRRN|nr:MFS transporter [Streptomyces rapamycinicus]AGP54275.1 MFS transporter [Streptomyces rapamycinicus NRRL 5491]MBB4781777.1 MFS family permease [Streptomyces rapamycinicus]RLV73580.1 MFS transporter [Streptomyces rapamycinicus NRRL 5491]UTO62348.1 MFS transporter [Streptomyces rapamycinicus]UTP30303.1 MFS transporter [Streptomyces rapamycinicus NRRL 5491]
MTETAGKPAIPAAGTAGEGHAPADPFGPRLMAPLLIGSVLNPVNSTMIATGLVAIGHDFGVGAARTAWLVASLYLASAVAQPAMGRLADLLGPRRVFLSGLLVVCAAGLVGALAPAFGWLIASRVLLGIGTSAAYPAAMALLRAQSFATGRETPRPVLGRLSLAALGSAAVGPVLGGVLTATAGWRAIFAVNVPLALIGITLALLWLPRTRITSPENGTDTGARTAGAAFDPLGITLFAATLTTLMIFLMDLARPNWALLPVVLVLAAVLTWWQLRRPRPFIDLRMIGRNRSLALTYLRHGTAYLVIYMVMYGYAQWLEEGHGYSASRAGLIMLPMSGAAAVCSLLGARTKGIYAPLVLAAVLLAAGSGVLLLADESTPLVALLLAAVLFGLPQGLSSTGNQAAVYTQAPPTSVGAAAGLQRTSQYLGAITAAGLIGLFYGQRATAIGLHGIAMVAGALSLVVLVLTATDRALRGRARTRT